jgi:enediyne biosynthesis protein E4
VDLDGDGDLDIVAVHWENERHRVLLNDGRGTFTDGTADYLPSGIVGPGVEVEAADFDRDGRVDLYVTSYRGADRLFVRRRPGA